MTVGVNLTWQEINKEPSISSQNTSAGSQVLEMTLRIPLNLVSHHRKIANVYKRWLRCIEGNSASFEEYRYKAVLARCEFDVIFNEKDMRKSKQMISEKENEFSKFKADPVSFADSPDGPAYQREEPVEDGLLDFWHPLEKAIYSDYFAKRELRKQQFIEMWEKQHGPPPPIDDH